MKLLTKNTQSHTEEEQVFWNMVRLYGVLQYLAHTIVVAKSKSAFRIHTTPKRQCLQFVCLVLTRLWIKTLFSIFVNTFCKISINYKISLSLVLIEFLIQFNSYSYVCVCECSSVLICWRVKRLCSSRLCIV